MLCILIVRANSGPKYTPANTVSTPAAKTAINISGDSWAVLNALVVDDSLPVPHWQPDASDPCVRQHLVAVTISLNLSSDG
jgi:hypothetical protein